MKVSVAVGIAVAFFSRTDLTRTNDHPPVSSTDPFSEVATVPPQLAEFRLPSRPSFLTQPAMSVEKPSWNDLAVILTEDLSSHSKKDALAIKQYGLDRYSQAILETFPTFDTQAIIKATTVESLNRFFPRLDDSIEGTQLARARWTFTAENDDGRFQRSTYQAFALRELSRCAAEIEVTRREATKSPSDTSRRNYESELKGVYVLMQAIMRNEKPEGVQSMLAKLVEKDPTLASKVR